MSKKGDKKVIAKLGWMMLAFATVTTVIAGIATYRVQLKQYKDLCIDSIIDVGDYLTELILEDPEDFYGYTEYYAANYDKLVIPINFNEYTTAKDRFYDLFAEEYPGKALNTDVKVSELNDELKNLYYTYRHEYWLLAFEQARASFGLPYTYFLTLDDTTHEVVYMIDGERTPQEDDPSLIYMGDKYYNDPFDYAIMWKTWSTGAKQNGVKEFDNKWGNTYAYYTPLVIKGEVLGLIAAEVNVATVNEGIMRNTLYLMARLVGILLLMSALLLFALRVSIVNRINFLSSQIDSFSNSRALETADAIRNYNFGNDEIATLAGNTANMICEIKEHEDEVSKVAKMKSDFLANMSHEIRTPMNAVIGMSDLILREEISDKARSYATQIKSSGNSLITIINDILDFSKIESGNMDIVKGEYEPSVMIDEVVNMTVHSLKGKPVEIKTDINPTLPEELYGDSVRIKQVLVNLVSNAIKFTKEGVVDIGVDYERLDDNNIMLKFEVSDTGIGIKDEHLNRIFESFSQVDSTRNRAVEGTGLGLAITKRLIELMNGTVSVESEFGKGSVFTIELPQEVCRIKSADANVSEGVAKSVLEFIAPEAKVMVVDDNQVNLFIMSGMLEPFGIKPVCVASGQEAIDEAGKMDYDIVFMDHMMPQMDGVEAAKIIREQYPQYKKIPVIAFTANAVEEAKKMLIESGMDDFLSKPVDSAGITRILRRWLPKDKVQFVKPNNQ